MTYKITAVSILSSPLDGSSFKVRVTVKNIGTGSGDAGDLKVWADQPESQSCNAKGGKSFPIGILEPNSSKTLILGKFYPGADGILRVLRTFVDSTCLSNESNENDNQLVKAYGYNDNAEAEQMALEYSGELLAPRAIYFKFRKDLSAIRQAYPVVENIYQRRSWVPGVVFIK